MSTSISRRIEDALVALDKRNYEGSLLHCFPAVDRTASIRRPNDKVGDRFKALLQDQFEIIAPVALGSWFGGVPTFGGQTYPEAIYKLARNSLVHEGELHSRLSIHSGSVSQLGGQWTLSDRHVVALLVAVISAKENHEERLNPEAEISFMGTCFRVNTLWGQESWLKSEIRKSFKSQ